MEDINSCVSCDFETGEPLTKCPSCGRRLRSAKKVRRLGWVLVTIGGFLVILMGAITFFVSSLISQAKEPGSSTRFTGSSADVGFIFGLFGVAIAIGLGSMVGGIWQIRYGKPNKFILFLVIGLAIVFYLVAQMYIASSK